MADTKFTSGQTQYIAEGLNNNFANRPQAVTQQSLTTPVTTTSQLIQRGFFYQQYAGGTPSAVANVTFPVAFDDTTYDLFISNIGYKDGSNPTSRVDITDQDALAHFTTDLHTVSGFRAVSKTIDGSSPASSRRVLFSWVAIGTKL